MAEHSETVFAEAEAHGGGYPRYVKDEVAAYLRCGIYCFGFARFACRSCGHERLVAYSCRGRGLCPSCITKRSALTAATLCDEVLPVCPYRGWTFTVPYELRLALIRDSALFSRVVTLFIRTVFRWQRRVAKGRGHHRVHCASVTMAQRYSSLLTLHPHAHSWLPDGVFVEREDGSLRFVRLPPPTDEDVVELCTRIRTRVRRLFEHLDEPVIDDDDATIAAVQTEAVTSPATRPLWFEHTPSQTHAPLSARVDGFSLHAGLFVDASKRADLERLLRYGSRPPFAQRRLSVLPSGQVRLKLRKAYYTGQTALLLDPHAFLRRLFAILPPPRWHLTRYHGMFSNHHHLRPKLTVLLPKPVVTVPDTTADADAGTVDGSIEPLPQTKRRSYAQLLSRTFPQDLGTCTRCGGPLRLIACIV